MISGIAIYRVSSFLYKIKVPVLPSLLDYLNRMVFACWIPHTARISTGTVVGYGGLCIVIHNRARIGANCHIDQGVTIGGTSKKHEVPVLGDRVYVGAGAKILGPITIGDDVVIGANSVVIKSVASNTVVAGVPAKVIKTGIKMSDYV